MTELKLTQSGDHGTKTIDVSEVMRTPIGLKVRFENGDIAYYHPAQYEEIRVIL